MGGDNHVQGLYLDASYRRVPGPFHPDAHVGHVTAEFLAWVLMFIVSVPTAQQATLHVKLAGIIQAQKYTRAEMKVRGMSTSPWK